MSRYTPRCPKDPCALTQREQELLKALARAGTPKGAAEILGVKPKGLNDRVATLREKLGVASTQDLITFWTANAA
jgi:DNA-binding NarL/FixJ family response regulator